MRISDITRLAIIDELNVRRVNWAGRLEEPDFLSRLFDVVAMPSTDGRFDNAYRDVWQHRVNNYDWDDDWVFYDARFNLLRGPDENFLRFLAETIHPAVRPDPSDVGGLVAMYNQHLTRDGYELAEVTQISGRPVYAARNAWTVPSALRRVERAATVADADYIARQVTRMESAIDVDPELAIGTSKELVETCCKTILLALARPVDKNWDLRRLLKEAAAELRFTPHDVDDNAPAAATIRQVLASLGNIVVGIAELRNAYGTGHGKAPGTASLRPRHARLAVGAASTLAVFLFETFEAREKSP